MAGLLSGQGWCFPAIICLSELAPVQHESVSHHGQKNTQRSILLLNSAEDEIKQ